jgi:hypothetical protein
VERKVGKILVRLELVWVERRVGKGRFVKYSFTCVIVFELLNYIVTNGESGVEHLRYLFGGLSCSSQCGEVMARK